MPKRKGIALAILVLSLACHASRAAGVAYRVHGLNFSPYMDGQDPNLRTRISEEQLRTRMSIIAQHTDWIRTFGMTDGLEAAGRIAHSLGLKAALGAWLSKDLMENQVQIANLIAAAQRGEADMVIVGSEVLLRGDLSEAALLQYIQQVKTAIPAGIPVTTADVYGELLAHPNVIAAVSVVLVNYYPYWQGIPCNVAVGMIHHWHQQVVAASGGKTVLVSETGWPSGGNPVGAAVPSPENAAFFFLNFVSWARANSVGYFYFEALDEAWKAAYEGPQGAHWGVWDKNGYLKPGMQDVFDGRTIPNNWSGTEIPGGPGAPGIEFAYVPPYGSFNDLIGQVWHVRPVDYKVAVYIRVSGGWWTKPYWASPSTAIRPDGSWAADITTGGSDQLADRLAAFLVPAGYSPPLLGGQSSLPAELYQNAAASVEVQRTPESISGRVTDAAGSPLLGVTLTLTGATTKTVQTASNGLYSFPNLQAGGSYTLRPSKSHYAFSPLLRSYINLTGAQTADFAAYLRPATAAFRNSYGNIVLTRQAASALHNAGGSLASDPAAAQNAAGDTVVAARDNYNSLWANVFNAASQTWGVWSFGAGVSQGMPAVAVATNGVAYIVVRDNWNTYWLISYQAGIGFGAWSWLGGVFSTDPVMAACADGSVYIVGKDNWNSMWSARYIPGSGLQVWQWGQGVLKGKLSATCGTDNVVYVVGRDNWDSLWLGRVQGNTWLGWSWGQGVMSQDPQAAAAGNGLIYVLARDAWGGLWQQGYTEGTVAGWQGWVYKGGVLQDYALAALSGEWYVAGRDTSNALWWYRSTGNQWTYIGHAGVAAGPLTAAPK